MTRDMFKYAVTTYGDLIRELISEDVDCYHESIVFEREIDKAIRNKLKVDEDEYDSDVVFFKTTRCHEFEVNSWVDDYPRSVFKNEKYHKFEGGTMIDMIKEI